MTTVPPPKFTHVLLAILSGAAVTVPIVWLLLSILPSARTVYLVLFTEPRFIVLATFLFAAGAAARRNFWHGREWEADPFAFAAGAFSGILTGMLLLFAVPALFASNPGQPSLSTDIKAQLSLLVAAVQFLVPVIVAKAVFRRWRGERG